MKFYSYDSILKEQVADSNWEEWDDKKIVRVIHDKIDFMLRDYGHLVVQEALDREEQGDSGRINTLFERFPSVFPKVNEREASAILNSLIIQEEVHKTYSVTNKVIFSFGWALDEMIQSVRGDTETLEKLGRALNKVGEYHDELYDRVLINLITGDIKNVDAFEVGHLLDETVRVDIVKKGEIRRA